MARLRQLHKRAFDDVDNYLNSSDLADYLGVSSVVDIHFPVPLSFVFVGFAGDGNQGVNVTSDELAGWFQHVDHVLPHARISLSELTCK